MEVTLQLVQLCMDDAHVRQVDAHVVHVLVYEFGTKPKDTHEV
jgi:hypothetical protein